MNELFSMGDKGGKSKVGDVITVMRKIISRKKMINLIMSSREVL